MGEPLKIVFVGLSLSSSWGNGHATTYRALLKALHASGHTCAFFEYDAPWYRPHRDLLQPEYADLRLYRAFGDAKDALRPELRDADAVALGSFTRDGVEVADWLFEEVGGDMPILFYDIDTPVTLRKLEEGDFEYLRADAIPRFDAYLSFSGGKAVERLVSQYGARRAIPFHCSADPELYYPEAIERSCALGYLGTYSKDRHAGMQRLLLDVAARLPQERFEVVGPQYPCQIAWPTNVSRSEHLPPSEHRAFYNRQRFTLNLTRGDMVALGHSPSVRLFEAAACGVPVISDEWVGIDAYFAPGEEIFIARGADDVVRFLTEVSEAERQAIGRRARARFLADHSPERRAAQFEEIVASLRATRPAESRA